MDALPELMLGASLLRWLGLMERAVSILPQAIEVRLGVPATIGLLMLGLVGAILGLINNWAQGRHDDVDA